MTEDKLVKYNDTAGNEIKLSPGIIRRHLVTGGGSVTDQEVTMFLAMCRFQHLNPFLKEAYLIKYGSMPATLVVGKEAFLKRAVQSPDYDGYEIDLDMGGDSITAARCRVYRKGLSRPASDVTVHFCEYVGRKKSGEVNSQWSGKPVTMLRKVALVQALREAFPVELGGMYSEDEISVGDIKSQPSAAESRTAAALDATRETADPPPPDDMVIDAEIIAAAERDDAWGQGGLPNVD